MLEEKFGQEFIDCVLGQCKPDCYLCINDNKRKMAGKGLTAKQKTLPSALQKKIMKKKK